MRPAGLTHTPDFPTGYHVAITHKRLQRSTVPKTGAKPMVALTTLPKAFEVQGAQNEMQDGDGTSN